MGGRAVSAVAALLRDHPLACAVFAALSSAACSVGQGTGSVSSTDLFVQDCWEGPFDLKPTFFGANPFNDTLTIRVQRGERDIQVSDGFTMLIYDVPLIRSSLIGQPLLVGLPVGVSPLGYPLPETPDPPMATLSLYLNNSCAGQNSQLLAVEGEVTFAKLFSGDPNEETSEDRITEGEFWAVVTDPRTAEPAAEGGEGEQFFYPDETKSRIEGEFRFVFHRGTPAQPFP
jgi:hypothetical protein